MEIKNTERADKQADAKQTNSEQGAEMDKWADFAGSLCASIGGAITYAVASRFKLTPLLKLTAVAGSGMALRPAAKSTFENAFVDPQYHTTGLQDCGWGAVDGLSGIFGAAAEAKVGSAFAQRIGQNALGREVSQTFAEETGKLIIKNSIGRRFAYNGLRSVTGGLTGTATFSAPHSLYDHRAEIAADPVNGLKNAAGQFAVETLAGGVLCGAASPFFTAIGGRREIFSKVADALKPKSELTPLRVLHFNDLHSNLLGSHSLSKVGGAVDAIRKSTSGRSVHLYSLGDEYSGNVISNFTGNGKLENQAIAALEPTATIPGNHAVDMGGGKTKVEPWIEIVNDLKNTDKDGISRVLAGNLEINLPGHEKFVGPNGTVKPFRIVEIETPNGGKDKVGLIGLVTNELEADGVAVNENYAAVAQKWIAELQKQGVKKIVVLSHLGFSEDQKLAQNVEGLSAIIGAHSHDATAVPHWTINQKTGKPVPIVQAGSEGKWLGDLELNFNKDGSANRFYTTGKLHPVTSNTPEHQGVKEMIEKSEMFHKVNELKLSKDYSGHVIDRPFSFGNTRRAETALGNLVSDAQMVGINKKLALRNEKPIELFLKHTGDIRKGLAANEPITGWHLSDVFCNGDNTRELCIANMSGTNIKNALEFGVADLSAAAEKIDPSGNFLQGSGFRYKFDLHKPVGERVSEIQVWNHLKNSFEEMKADQIYKIGTLLHPIDKWAKNNVFADSQEFQQILKGLATSEPSLTTKQSAQKAAHEFVQSKLVNLSQPRLLDQFIGNPLNVKVASRVGGRFQNISAKPWAPSINAMVGVNASEVYFDGAKVQESQNASLFAHQPHGLQNGFMTR